MGNIQGSVLDSAKRTTPGSNNEDMKTLRYAVREELKHLAEDPSQRTLYKLLHPTIDDEVEADMTASESQAAINNMETAPSASNNHDASRYDAEPSSPDSPRLIIDETIESVANNPEAPPDCKSGADVLQGSQGFRAEVEASFRHLLSGEKERSLSPTPVTSSAQHSVAELPRPRSGSISCMAPKKKFLVDYNSQLASESAQNNTDESRQRACSFSVNVRPNQTTGSAEENRSRASSFSAASMRQGHKSSDGKTDSGGSDKVQVNFRECINIVLDSEEVRRRLKTPPEELPTGSEDSSMMDKVRASISSELAPNIQPTNLQQQMTQVMKSVEATGSSSSHSSRTSTPHGEVGRKLEGDDAGRSGGPLDLMAAQVDSMPPPVSTGVNRTSELEAAVPEPSRGSSPKYPLPPVPTQPSVPYPTDQTPQTQSTPDLSFRPTSHQPPTSVSTMTEPFSQSFAASARVRSHTDSVEAHHPKVATILPIPQPPRDNTDSPSPAAPDKPPYKIVMSEEWERRPPLEKRSSPLITGGVRKDEHQQMAWEMEERYRTMIKEDILKVWNEDDSKSRPTTRAATMTSPAPPKQGMTSYRERSASYSATTSNPGSHHWQSYKPQTGQERADIIRDARNTIIYPEGRGMVQLGGLSDDQHKVPYLMMGPSLTSDKYLPPRDDERVEGGRVSDEVPLDLSAKPGSEEMKSRPTSLDHRAPHMESMITNMETPVKDGVGDKGNQNLAVSGMASSRQTGNMAPYSVPRSVSMVTGAIATHSTHHIPNHQLKAQEAYKNLIISDPSAASLQHSPPAFNPSQQPSLASQPHGAPSSRLTVGSLLGDHSANDILFLRCNICDLTYGSLHSFRKHFHKAHNQDPSKDHITIQTISATKNAMDKAQMGEEATKMVENYRMASDNDSHNINMPPNANTSYDYKLAVKHKQEEGLGKSELIPQPMLVSALNPHNLTGSAAIRGGEEMERRMSLPTSNGPSVFKCPHCLLEFPTRDWGAYTRHVKSHETAVNPTPAASPSKGKDGWGEKEKGAGVVAGEAVMVCHLCRAMFSQQEALIRHYQTVHGKVTLDASVDYHCQLCSKTFVHESGLLAHLPDHGERAIALLREVKERGGFAGVRVGAEQEDQRRSQHSPHAPPTIFSSQPRNAMDPPSTAALYSRRMSFSESPYRGGAGVKRHGANALQEDVKRPRSGSFPNVHDLLERRLEGSRGGSLHPMSHFTPPPATTHHHFNHHSPNYPATKITSNQPSKRHIDEPPPSSSSQAKRAKDDGTKPPSTARSLIDQMVESAVSELATDATNSQPKILPRLFKGDPMDKVWPQERSAAEGERGDNTAAIDRSDDRVQSPRHRASPLTSDRISPAVPPSAAWATSEVNPLQRPTTGSDTATHNRPTTNTVDVAHPTASGKNPLLSMAFVPSKRPENVRDIIESLVTAEMTGVGVARPRANSEHRPDLTRPKYSPYTNTQCSPGSRQQLDRHLKTPVAAASLRVEPMKRPPETIRETISQAIEKSINSTESFNREDRTLSRLRQLMTGAPDFVRKERERMDYLPRGPKKPVNPPPADDSEPQKFATGDAGKVVGGKSMREICDQIIAESLSHTSNEVKADVVMQTSGEEEGFRARSFSASAAQSPHLLSRLYGRQYVPSASALLSKKNLPVPHRAASAASPGAAAAAAAVEVDNSLHRKTISNANDNAKPSDSQDTLGQRTSPHEQYLYRERRASVEVSINPKREEGGHLDEAASGSSDTPGGEELTRDAEERGHSPESLTDNALPNQTSADTLSGQSKEDVEMTA